MTKVILSPTAISLTILAQNWETTDKTKLAFVSEEELAIVNAINSAFPESTYLIYRRYLYQNTKQNYCAYKTDRQNIMGVVFNASVSVLIQNNRK